MSDPEFVNVGTPFAKLTEECGELLKAAAKIDRFGAHERHPDGGPENIAKLMDEWADLEDAYVRFLSSFGL